MTHVKTAGVILGVLMGLAAGLSIYTFVYARGTSYLTNDPTACANCHVMQGHYDAWSHSSHRAVAVCNDCHAPHTFVGKYVSKGINGFNHSWAFTTGRFHEPIQVTAFNERIIEGACRNCHQDIVQMIDHGPHTSEPLSCIRCHPAVGHMH